MSRNTEYQFVSIDAEALETQLVAAYEELTGSSVNPASPEKLFISWVTNIILQERAYSNYIGNQNIPSRAEGENLDALAELFYSVSRPEAQPATCTVHFVISQAQESSIIIPAGTRVTDLDKTYYWETLEDAYIPAGDTSIDLTVQCQTKGTCANGYTAGQINTLVDIFDYYESCSNTTESGGGSDEYTDDELYALLKASQDAFSVAGPRGAYIYFAKSVSDDIADVAVNSPTAGTIKIYAVTSDGDIAGTELKAKILAKCSEDSVRPLTDNVEVCDAETSEYNINVTYYVESGAEISLADLSTNILAKINEYKTWQDTKIGRDINPSKLLYLLMQTGIKRAVISEPAFTHLTDGSDGTSTPQVAHNATVTYTFGGYEDE